MAQVVEQGEVEVGEKAGIPSLVSQVVQERALVGGVAKDVKDKEVDYVLVRR